MDDSLTIHKPLPNMEDMEELINTQVKDSNFITTKKWDLSKLKNILTETIIERIYGFLFLSITDEKSI